MPRLQIAPLTVDDAPAAARTLARAFAVDPFFSYVFPEEATRDPAILWYLAATTRACIALGGAFGTRGDPIGVALWVPTNGEFGSEIERASGLNQRAEIFGADAEARYQFLGAHFGELHRRDMPMPHRYLTILGVDPGRQGSGVGGAVLRPGLDAADRDQVVCYTETTRARNVPFYERHGFAVIEAGAIDSVPFWTFRREPAAASEPASP